MSKAARKAASPRPRKSIIKRPARGTYHHGDLRRALIDSALRILQEEEIPALSLRRAARAAGVSQAAPYRHFADKEELLAAVAEEGFRSLSTAVERATAGMGDDPLGRFRIQGLTYIRFAVEHPAQFRLMFGGDRADRSTHPGLKAAADETFARLMGAVREGQSVGLMRPGNPLHQAMASWSMVHGLSSLLVHGQLAPGGEPLDTFAFRALQYLFLGLRSDKPTL